MPCLPLKDFFDLLCSLKNDAGWVQEPGGRGLIKFLAEKATISPVAITRKIDELLELNCIEKEFRGHKLWRVKILRDFWESTRLNEKTEKEKFAFENTEKPIEIDLAQQPEEAPGKKPEKMFAIFMDFLNLERGLPKHTNRFRDFSWLLDPILKQGKVIYSFVFIPEHYASRAPIMQLTHKHFFYSILCPRQIGDRGIKDVDTVDEQMKDLAWALIEHDDITDVVIVTGDGDFHRLAERARWQQKNVTVVSTARALSGRFLEMEKDNTLEVRLV